MPRTSQYLPDYLLPILPAKTLEEEGFSTDPDLRELFLYFSEGVPMPQIKNDWNTNIPYRATQYMDKRLKTTRITREILETICDKMADHNSTFPNTWR